MKIKKEDEVIVLAGKYKGQKGTVTKAMPRDGKVVVSGINKVKRHNKPGMGGPGGIQEKELPIDISNVAYFDGTNNKPSRIGYKRLEDGSKVRYAKSSGEQID